VLEKNNLIYLLAGAAGAYAFFCWRDKRQHMRRKRMRMMHDHGPSPHQAMPSPTSHPRQRGLMLPAPAAPAPPPMQVAPPPMQVAPPPPAGAGAPPAMAGMGMGDQFVPNSHDIVQVASSPHVRRQQVAPPPANVMPMSQDPFEVAPGVGPVELQGF
jgi:hypothetical protein